MISRLYEAVEYLDGLLDKIPSYEDGQWYRNGQWGCRIGLYKIWSRGLTGND